jgi:hypothetical protein
MPPKKKKKKKKPRGLSKTQKGMMGATVVIFIMDRVAPGTGIIASVIQIVGTAI